MRGQVSCPNLDPSSPTGFGRSKIEREKERERKSGIFRERSSTLSLEFSAIGPSVSGEARSKVDPHGKGYAWLPVLGSFNKLQEVGVFSYLIYPLFKCFVNALVDLRP